MKRISYLIFAVVAIATASCAKESFDAQGQQPQLPQEPAEVAGEVVVKFDESLSDILDMIGKGRSGVATRSGITTVDEVLDLIGGYGLERVFPVDPRTEEQTREAGLHLWYVVRFSDDYTVEEVVSRLSKLGEVQAASPVRTIKRAYNESRKAVPLSRAVLAAAGTSRNSGEYMFNDELLKYQWHLVNRGWGEQFVHETLSGYEDQGKEPGYDLDETAAEGKFTVGSDISCERAWEKCLGDPSIIVAVLDEAVCLTHPDLQQNIWVNEDEVWGSLEDNDGNGYAGDRYGYDFLNDKGVLSWDRDGDTGHGTHVAGIIAAVNNNGIGISSVAGGTPEHPGVKIMSCQIFSGNSSTSNILYMSRAIKYAADNGAVVLQCSWGYLSGASNMYENGGQGYRTEEEWAEACPLEKSVMDYFRHHAGSPDGVIEGGIPVFASGNEYAPMAGFPGAAEGCVSVAAIAADFTPSTFTNYGDFTRISAPGGDMDYYYEFIDDEHARGDVGTVLSTLPFNISETGYGYMEGTSMACPHVSGVVALGLSYAAQQHRHFRAEEILDLLYSSASDIDDIISAKKTKLYYKYQSEVNFTQPQTMTMASYAGKMGYGLVNADAFLDAIADGGVDMVFPNLYVQTKGSVTVAPSYYLDGDSYSVTVDDPSVATVAVKGSGSSGGASVSGAGASDMLVFYGLSSGSTTARITSGSTTQEFVITVRNNTDGSGWL